MSFQTGQKSQDGKAHLWLHTGLCSEARHLGISVLTLTFSNTGLDFMLDLGTLNGLGKMYPHPTQIKHLNFRNVQILWGL